MTPPLQSVATDILVIHDHEPLWVGLLPTLQKHYPNSVIHQALAGPDTGRILDQCAELMLIIADLSLPTGAGNNASTDVGFDLLERLLSHPKSPNLLVLSPNLKSLIRLGSKIKTYGGGFTTADKRQSIPDMMQMAELSRRGTMGWSNLLRQVGMTKELDQQWLDVVKLRFQQGLNDKAIAQRMHVSDRTIRNYWLKLQDHLGIPDDPSHDARVQIMLKLKEFGLFD
ncbi:MAG: response regulator transcription factor [Acaryochloridaceae cyanobacterium RL_2_7]|nr:response regulator transcription factor [Acaryochloridaceae cyanobacterium RL_2_7]